MDIPTGYSQTPGASASGVAVQGQGGGDFATRYGWYIDAADSDGATSVGWTTVGGPAGSGSSGRGVSRGGPSSRLGIGLGLAATVVLSLLPWNALFAAGTPRYAELAARA